MSDDIGAGAAGWLGPILPTGTAAKSLEQRQKVPLPDAARIIQPLPDADLPPRMRLAASMFGKMLFPDPGEQEMWWTAAYVAAMYGLKPEPSHQPTKEQMNRVLRFMELSSWPEVRERWRRGLVAGEVLRFITRIALQDPSKVSLSKAIDQAALYFQKDVRTADAERLGKDTIRDYWTTFLPVAHLWAGYLEHVTQVGRVIEQESTTRGDARQKAWHWFICDPSTVIAFATNHLGFIEQHIPPSKKPAAPIVQAADLWMPPPWSIPKEQPDFLDPAKLWTGLTEKYTKALSAYKKDRGRSAKKPD